MSEVHNNSAEYRFELEAEGYIAMAHYTLAPGVITFTHTLVPKELEGHGVGSKLARGALDSARALGLKVVPKCPFFAGYIGKHPEYADLVAA